MNEEMRNLLAQYLSKRNDMLGTNVRAPQGAEGDYNLPQASVQSQGSGAPAVRGEYSMGDGLSVRGDFHRPNPQDKPRWGAMLDYRKSF
jgi:hypothetical protein